MSYASIARRHAALASASVFAASFPPARVHSAFSSVDGSSETHTAMLCCLVFAASRRLSPPAGRERVDTRAEPLVHFAVFRWMVLADTDADSKKAGGAPGRHSDPGIFRGRVAERR